MANIGFRIELLAAAYRVRVGISLTLRTDTKSVF